MEKIKISINENVLRLLKKDCADFSIKKPNGEINFNAFVNTLIANFYQQFSSIDDQLIEDINSALDGVSQKQKQTMVENVFKAFTKRQQQEDVGENVVFSFKPTKVSQKANNFIQHVLLASESLSSYYRRLFAEYAHKPKNERELIIFKDTHSQLSKAIKKQTQALISYGNNQVLNNATVYYVGHSKDELFNYALIFCDGKNVTLRLSKINGVSLLSTKSYIPDENKTLFDKQIENDVQYPFYNTDVTPIKVKLTQKGVQLFEKIYLYRPTPIAIENDVYTFNCSSNQLLYYFKRFGEHAIILEPTRIGIFMRNYYYYSFKAYRGLFNDAD